MTRSSLGYEEVGARLTQARIEVGAAECDGLLCGLLCGNRATAQAQLLAEILPEGDERDLSLQDCRQALDARYDEAVRAFDDPQMGFEPLLPGDEEPLPTRALAVRDWCTGFLYGMGLSGVQRSQGLTEETQEALQDFSEITRMDVAALAEAGEEEEESLMQLTEFLRVAVMLVHDDLGGKRVEQE